MKKKLVLLVQIFFSIVGSLSYGQDKPSEVCGVYNKSDLIINGKIKKNQSAYQVYRGADGKLYGQDFVYGKTVLYGTDIGGYALIKKQGGILTLQQDSPGDWSLVLNYTHWLRMADRVYFKVRGPLCDGLLMSPGTNTFLDFVSRGPSN